jgi:hypothetical protein
VCGLTFSKAAASLVFSRRISTMSSSITDHLPPAALTSQVVCRYPAGMSPLLLWLDLMSIPCESGRTAPLYSAASQSVGNVPQALRGYATTNGDQLAKAA